MDLEVLRWLLTGDGQAALAQASRLQAERVDPARAGDLLRRSLTGERAAAAMSQAELRAAARDKLGPDADRLYLTRDGLEQATRHEAAAHRAARLAHRTPGTLVDLGCGIGADLLAGARAGLEVTGVDRDPLRAALARANLDALGLAGTVRVADAASVGLDPFDRVYADPARRTPRGRVFDVDSYSPPWSFVESLMSRPACVKVAPGVPHDRVPAGAEAEWVSVRGEVKEAALWSPALATTPRRATVLGTPGPGDSATLSSADLPPDAPRVAGVGAYLHEPDGAVIRAGLVGAVAAAVGGWLLDEHIAYVATDEPAPMSPRGLARRYAVIEEAPYQERRLRPFLRERRIGRLTIKKRGVSVVPDDLRRRLALRGEEEATLVLTRVSGRGIGLLVRPLN